MELDVEITSNFMLVNTIKCKRRVLVFCFLVPIGVTKFCRKVLEKQLENIQLKIEIMISFSSWKIVQI